MINKLVLIGAALLGAASVLVAGQNCTREQLCPQEAPCCSQYGQCGIGAYCLGGCDPTMSYALDSCMPAPVCESKTYPMNSLNGIVDVSKYLGDPSTADWVSQGEPLVYDGNVLLTMAPNSVGTVLASTSYMWYGNVQATLKTSRGAGVVTAFILLSDVKDEIDYEFVGTELTIAQTNYYWQAVPDYTNSYNITTTDTYENFHTYEVQWTPDSITWLVDGVPGRVRQRSDTWNTTSNGWDFPQTPARVQLSIWPGGASSNAPGTVSWAGGAIDWDSQDIQSYGYDFATFGEIVVSCYNATSAPGTNTGVSYTYDSVAGTNASVVDGNSGTVLSSFLGNGEDPSLGASASSTGTQTSAAAPVASIPGGSNAGPGSSGSDGGNTGSGSGSGSGSGTASGPECSATGFTQSCTTSSTSGKSDGVRVASPDHLLGASAFAVVIALGGMMLL